ncbi:MAG: hypothetical protein KKB70_08575 [Proteobacteria bacterium]|nr:hypothetical protein [Pseudomonadota bacterium]
MKIQNTKAWVIQAIYDPGSEILFKGLWVGVKEEVESVKGKLAGLGSPLSVDGEEIPILRRPYGRIGMPIKRIPGSPYFMGGMNAVEELPNIIIGDNDDELCTQAFDIMQRQSSIPLLRSWMPVLWNDLLTRADVVPLATYGFDKKVFHVKLPSTQNWEKIIMANMPELIRLAETEIKVAQKAA